MSKSKYHVRYDWKEIQAFYDEGNSYSEITEKFGAAPSTILRARQRGDLILNRSSSEAQKLSQKKYPRVLSQETKDKISVKMVEYFQENPDKIGYVRNHWSRGKSWPEMVIEQTLIANNISDFEYNYQCGIYSYDFAWLDIKLDVEIDGGTHTLPEVIEKDKRRDTWSIKNGWTVLRFTAKQVKNDLQYIINTIKYTIDNLKIMDQLP